MIEFNEKSISSVLGKFYYDSRKDCTVDQLIGKIFVDYLLSDEKDFLAFKDSEGEIFVFYHPQDCCESVYLNDVTGDLDDLMNTPLLLSEESSAAGESSDEYCDSSTWTFYKFGTIKGYVDIRWLGTSNGYYSESVSLVQLIEK